MRNPSLSINLDSVLQKELWIKVRMFNTYLKGTLIAFDQYSNLLLESVREYITDPTTHQPVEKHVYEGTVLLRGDSIISFSANT